MRIKEINLKLSYVFLFFILILAILPYFSFLKSGTIPSGTALLPPSKEHWFGTDDLGIDIFSEICYGAKNTIILSCSSALFAAIGGSVIGMVAGYFGGIFDEILLGIIDFFISVPDLLLMVVLGTFLGPSLRNIVFSIVLVSWIMPAKITRSQILRMKQENYIKIAKIYGAGFIHLFLWHFWKPFFSIIMISVIKLMNRAILAEAALSYLGLGDPLSKSWGMIITRAMDFPNIYLTEFWKWWLVYPVTFMVLMVLSIAIIGQKIERKIGGVYRTQ
ncbi:ABC transporter permease [Fusobacterium nucleatum]|uniref:ABC transporter permease n=2 Tax=Fusobacterium nucleatum subsp. nucleatum TaxID=76856 RepID=Q8RGT5_FUSNN|nr:ABC transporter permease [Fusobacterium nucleatum]AAL94400.1 Dipeptide transport system permease protein dppC [Fusobacterium nucleatum subsp. nucleatum ATCC 25586]ALF23649.1 peptide ABC transporter permease [Fusobacterium nucleatum subsp. nucleatum ChDC F316]ALF26604.1 peptide ABC transporter permease [Fusobacterium nucleatum subsp. nucleatum]ASG26987.1 ABC transporter permease [Fusobacterium nucleatum subsp. nucleatum]AVQ14696.1 ABC transporter permease [Fusobacterium nucleatum subsp. nucl